MSAAVAAPLDAASLFRPGLPPPAAPFAGRAPFAFDNGDNDSTGVPVEALAEIAAEVILRHGADLAYYHLGGSPLGHAPLREHLAERLRRTRGMQVGADDILITSGSTQGLDLVNDLLLAPGDCVLVEAHTYSAALNRFRRLGMRTEVVALDDQGIDVAALEATLERLAFEGVRPKYLYAIPTIQNPTGTVMPMARRLALIELARRHGFLIFEDECYAELTWADAAPASLFALAPDACIHIGSLSKTLAPALRVGYLTAAPQVLLQILALKRDGGVGALNQMIAAEYFARRHGEHLAALKVTLKAKCERMIEAVAREFGVAAEVRAPEGGMFLWARLDPAIDVARLIEPARAAGVVFNAGPDWSVNPADGAGLIRLCFAAPSLEDIDEGVARLAQVCRETFGVPERSANSSGCAN